MCPSSQPLRVLTLGGLLVTALLVGCTRKPRAPALTNDPVYRNDREGFRFLAPEGWKLFARADVPPGKVAKERLLVQYKRQASAKGATLEVSLADLSSAEDLAKYLAGPSFGAQQWRAAGAPESLEVGGAEATRYAYTAQVSRDNLAKEVTAFRRGERVYFFTGLFVRDDGKARDEVRRAVGSTLWK